MKVKNAPTPGQIITSIPWKKRELSIRHVRLSDWKSCWQYINTLSAERTFILMQGNHVTQQQEKRFIVESLRELNQQKGMLLVIADGNRIVGVSGISLRRFAEGHVGSLGISIAADYRDKGLGTLFLKTVITEAKRCLSRMSILTLEVYANNPRAQRLYETCGFVTYGRLPNGIFYKGTYVDSLLMCRTI